jgi:hypothetical protein
MDYLQVVTVLWDAVPVNIKIASAGGIVLIILIAFFTVVVDEKRRLYEWVDEHNAIDDDTTNRTSSDEITDTPLTEQIHLDDKDDDHKEIAAESKSVTANSRPGFNGVFEIRITVDVSNSNYTNLLSFIKDNDHKRHMKVVFAVTSGGNNQYMLSYFTRKSNEQLAITDATNTANILLNNYGITVLRTKVEGHNCIGTPNTDEEYWGAKMYLRKYRREFGSQYTSSSPYFEFHVKVNDGNPNFESNTMLEKDVAEVIENSTKLESTLAGVSYNLCSSNRKPLLTIRVYEAGFIKAQDYKDEILDALKGKGYTFEDKIQQEFSIYDSNVTLDEGWLE